MPLHLLKKYTIAFNKELEHHDPFNSDNIYKKNNQTTQQNRDLHT